MKNKLLLSLIAIGLVFASCDNNSVNPEPAKPSSVYVANMGNFSEANGSVVSFDPKTGQIVQQTFQNVNSRPMAGIIQSISAFNGKLYLSVNSANKIEVVDPQTFESITTIPLKATPMDVAPAGTNTIYITNLYGNNVLVMNTETHEILKKIPVGKNPWEMVTVNEFTFVSNYGYGDANTVSVINNKTNKVVKTLTVGRAPKDLEVDKRGRVWVVCNGKKTWDKVPNNGLPGALYVLNGQNATIIKHIEMQERLADFAINSEKGVGYLLGDGVYMVDLDAITLKDQLFTEGSYNAARYAPAVNLLYLGISNGVTQPGKVVRFNLQGAPIDTFKTGMKPIAFYFVKGN